MVKVRLPMATGTRSRRYKQNLSRTLRDYFPETNKHHANSILSLVLIQLINCIFSDRTILEQYSNVSKIMRMFISIFLVSKHIKFPIYLLYNSVIIAVVIITLIVVRSIEVMSGIVVPLVHRRRLLNNRFNVSTEPRNGHT